MVNYGVLACLVFAVCAAGDATTRSLKGGRSSSRNKGSSSSSSSSSDDEDWIITGAVVGAFVVLLIGCVIYTRYRQKKALENAQAAGEGEQQEQTDEAAAEAEANKNDITGAPLVSDSIPTMYAATDMPPGKFDAFSIGQLQYQPRVQGYPIPGQEVTAYPVVGPQQQVPAMGAIAPPRPPVQLSPQSIPPPPPPALLETDGKPVADSEIELAEAHAVSEESVDEYNGSNEDN